MQTKRKKEKQKINSKLKMMKNNAQLCWSATAAAPPTTKHRLNRPSYSVVKQKQNVDILSNACKNCSQSCLFC